MQILDEKMREETAVGSLSEKVKSAGFMETANVADRTFSRSAFFAGEPVSAVDIVNVLGRWRSFEEWNSKGVLTEMDALFDESGVVTDSPALQRAWQRWDEQYITGKSDIIKERLLKVKGDPDFRAKNLPVWSKTRAGLTRDPAFGKYEQERLVGPQPDAARSPARRGFCIRRGQAQRWWHNENIAAGLLPFTSEALAASVGMTAEELNARPPKWEACDVVFDALSRSQSGLIDKTLIDERRAAYENSDGSFAADAFDADLTSGRINIAVGNAIFPGSLNLVFLIGFIQADGWSYALQAYSDLSGTVAANTALWGRMLGM